VKFLYVFPRSDKEGRAISVRQRDDGKLFVTSAPCAKNSAPDKAIGRAVCRARFTAYQYDIMTIEELAAYIERIRGEPVTLQELEIQLAVPSYFD